MAEREHYRRRDKRLTHDLTLTGMTFEGVVCKSTNDKKTMSVMFKKNKAWIDKLKAYCGDNKDLYNALI